MELRNKNSALPPLFLHNRKFRSPSSLTNCCVVKASDFGLNGNVIDLSTAIIYDYWQSCSSEYNTFSTVSKLLERLKPKQERDGDVLQSISIRKFLMCYTTLAIMIFKCILDLCISHRKYRIFKEL